MLEYCNQAIKVIPGFSFNPFICFILHIQMRRSKLIQPLLLRITGLHLFLDSCDSDSADSQSLLMSQSKSRNPYNNVRVHPDAK